MKLKPILIPITSLSIASIGLTACNSKSAYVSVPTEYLVVTDGVLTGYDDTKDYKDYNTISIPNIATSVIGFMDKPSTPFFDSITTIAYEDGSKLLNLGATNNNAFAHFNNVETLILPNTIESMSDKAFYDMKKLSTIDISSYTSSPLWLVPDGFDAKTLPSTGKFFVANNTVKSYIQRKLLVSDPFTNWTVEIK